MAVQSSLPATLGAATRTMRLVHAALTAAVGIYVVVVAVLVRRPADPQAGAAAIGVLPYAFAAAAVGSLVALVVLRRKMMPAREPPAQLADRIADDDPLPEPARRALGKVFAASIVTWALAESVAIYGFVLGILLRDVRPMLPFAAVSIAVLLAYAPRRALLEAAVRAARR